MRRRESAAVALAVLAALCVTGSAQAGTPEESRSMFESHGRKQTNTDFEPLFAGNTEFTRNGTRDISLEE